MKQPTQYRAFPVFAAAFLALALSGVALPRLAAASGIDESILPTIYQTLWAPGVPGGIPADNDPVRPASVWLPAGDPYHGYSVNPALTGTANAAAFSSAFQAAINSAGAAAKTGNARYRDGCFMESPLLESTIALQFQCDRYIKILALMREVGCGLHSVLNAGLLNGSRAIN